MDYVLPGGNPRSDRFTVCGAGSVFRASQWTQQTQSESPAQTDFRLHSANCERRPRTSISRHLAMGRQPEPKRSEIWGGCLRNGALAKSGKAFFPRARHLSRPSLSTHAATLALTRLRPSRGHGVFSSHPDCCCNFAFRAIIISAAVQRRPSRGMLDPWLRLRWLALTVQPAPPNYVDPVREVKRFRSPTHEAQYLENQIKPGSWFKVHEARVWRVTGLWPGERGQTYPSISIEKGRG